MLLSAVDRLGAFWGLGAGEVATLMGVSRATWFRWREALGAGREPRIGEGRRGRGLALLRIVEAVGDLHQDDAEVQRWPREPISGPGFEGRTPLEVMLSGVDGLLQVRGYLDFVLNALS